MIQAIVTPPPARRNNPARGSRRGGFTVRIAERLELADGAGFLHRVTARVTDGSIPPEIAAMMQVPDPPAGHARRSYRVELSEAGTVAVVEAVDRPKGKDAGAGG